MRYEWKFPYSPDLIAVAKSLKMRWDPQAKCWWSTDTEVGEAIKDNKVVELANARAKKVNEAIEASKATSLDIILPVPEGLAYLPFQRAGIAYCMERERALIADEMGLGKTIQLLGYMNANQDIVKNVLLICPATIKTNWQREMEKWLIKDYTIGIAEGKDLPNTDIVIINFEIVKNHVAALHERDWDLLGIDEAHRLKNQKALRTQLILGERHRAKKINNKWEYPLGYWKTKPIEAKKCLFLTGSPIVNRPKELFTLLTALDPEGLGKNFFAFGRRYCNGRQNGFGWDFDGASNLDELQRKLRATCMARRLKKDVLKELPPKRRQVIPFAATGRLKKFVDAESNAVDSIRGDTEDLAVRVELAKASEDPEAYREAVRALTSRMAVAFEEISRVRRELAIEKAPLVVEYIQEALESSEKIVVFAHHHEVIDTIAEALGDIVVRLDGRMPMKDRQVSIDRFQEDESVRVFVGGIHAAGVGITLTRASHVIFAELDWVPGNMSQAEDRCHRFGQLESVLVQHLVVDGSLDAYLAGVLIEKQIIIEQALDGGAELALHDIPLLPIKDKSATGNVSKGDLYGIAAKLTDTDVALIQGCLTQLAVTDTDRAMARNDMGFNRFDGKIGHSLASSPVLTKKQAALGLKLCQKYNKTQLGGDLTELLDRVSSKK